MPFILQVVNSNSLALYLGFLICHVSLRKESLKVFCMRYDGASMLFLDALLYVSWPFLVLQLPH